MLDLLDLLDAQDEPRVVHLIMPSMGLACGRPILKMFDAREVDGYRRTALTISRATCPDCLAPGAGAIKAERARQQGRQAQVES